MSACRHIDQEMADIFGDRTREIFMPSTNRRVLYVEDDPDSTELLSAILHDHEVVGAKSVADALEYLKQYSFHYIILDQKLPDGTGTDVLRFIRKTDQNVPVIFVTGLDDFDSGPDGAEGVIKKGRQDFFDRVLAFVDRERDPSVWNLL